MTGRYMAGIDRSQDQISPSGLRMLQATWKCGDISMLPAHKLPLCTPTCQQRGTVLDLSVVRGIYVNVTNMSLS